MSFGFGDALAAAGLLWEVYSRCRDAPDKMREACNIVDAIRNELEFLEPEVKKATGPRGEVPAFFTDLQSTMTTMTSDIAHLRELVTKWDEQPLQRPWLIARMYKVDNLRRSLATCNHTLERKVQYLLLERINTAKAQHERAMKGLRQQVSGLQMGGSPVVAAASASAMLSPQQQQQGGQKDGRRNSTGRKSPSPARTPSPAPSGDAAENNVVTKPERAIKSILIVDKMNYARSAMCQAFLELSRVRAANANGRWLFDRVSSAGFGIERDFTKECFDLGILTEKPVSRKATKLSKRAINTVERILANTKPREYTDILSRLRETDRRGLALSHFQFSDVIICFGGDTYRVLRQMRAYAAQELAAQNNVCRGWIMRFDVPMLSEEPTRDECDKCFTLVHQRMTEFLWTKLNWVGPANMDIVSGPYRTRQLLVNQAKTQAFRSAVSRIQETTGCLSVQVNRFSNISGKILVSIIGPKETLDRAEEMVMAING